MSYSHAEENWNVMKRKVKETWSELSDRDLEIIRGKKHRLAGVLQERYGYSFETAQTEIENFVFKNYIAPCITSKEMPEASIYCD